MQNYVALLRGINVSGQKKIPMKELKSRLDSEGLFNVETYIQSGNVLFDVDEADERDLTDVIEKAIKDEFGFDVPTLVLAQDTFERVISHNPFLTAEVDTKKLYVAFLYDLPAEELMKQLEAPTPEDEFNLAWPFIYLYYANGMGKSKMDNNFFERKLKVRTTTRNWNTIKKLAGQS